MTNPGKRAGRVLVSAIYFAVRFYAYLEIKKYVAHQHLKYAVPAESQEIGSRCHSKCAFNIFENN